MVGQGSMRYDVIKLRELINRDINYKSDSSQIELQNQIIKGDDLADALREINAKEVREHYEELVNNLEFLFKGKEGTLAKRIMNLVGDAKKILK